MCGEKKEQMTRRAMQFKTCPLKVCSWQPDWCYRGMRGGATRKCHEDRCEGALREAWGGARVAWGGGGGAEVDRVRVGVA